MKNISRRVFIKGMAVAAVATAASTVLTGCKLPAGTEGETEVVTTPANTYTFKDGDNTLTVAATKLETNTVGLGGAGTENVYVYVDVENKLSNDNTLYIWGNAYTNDSNDEHDQVVVTYTLIDKEGQTIKKDTVPTGVAAKNGIDSMFYGQANAVQVSKNSKKSGYIFIGTVSDEWVKLELTFKYYKSYKTDSNYALDQVGKTTFTFNK